MTIPLSVYMITYNNGPTIEKALASVAGWAPEVVVVDSESTDGAREIIRTVHGPALPALHHQPGGEVRLRPGPLHPPLGALCRRGRMAHP